MKIICKLFGHDYEYYGQRPRPKNNPDGVYDIEKCRRCKKENLLRKVQ
jgi:hypothetical protein